MIFLTVSTQDIVGIQAGLMREDELARFKALDNKVIWNQNLFCCTKNTVLICVFSEQVAANKWFLPLVWTAHLIILSLEENRQLQPNNVRLTTLEFKLEQHFFHYLFYNLFRAESLQGFAANSFKLAKGRKIKKCFLVFLSSSIRSGHMFEHIDQ